MNREKKSENFKSSCNLEINNTKSKEIMNRSAFSFIFNLKNTKRFVAALSGASAAMLCSTATASYLFEPTASPGDVLRFKPIFKSVVYAKDIKDDDNENNIEGELKKISPIITNPRKRIFFQYASIEYDGIPYMTPYDFIDSVTGNRMRPFSKRKVVRKEDVDKFLKDTPPISKNSTKYFRNLESRGLITYSEYIFLLCCISKPRSSFEIAFNMFDIDGNKNVDKKEFLVVTKIFQRNADKLREKLKALTKSSTNMNEENNNDENKQLLESIKVIDVPEYVDTTLLVHLFGKRGDKALSFKDFKRFMENLQIEVLEVEFNEFSKGLSKISEIEFAEILLRYTDFNEEKKTSILNRLETQIEEYSRGITFENFLKFSQFMNNLDDFSLAIKYHLYATGSVSKSEFQRAIKVSSGFELDEQIVDVIFKVFDENFDNNLSYKEFIEVMKDRLRRNPKAYTKIDGHYDENIGFGQEFKLCMKEKLQSDDYYA